MKKPVAAHHLAQIGYATRKGPEIWAHGLCGAREAPGLYDFTMRETPAQLLSVSVQIVGPESAETTLGIVIACPAHGFDCPEGSECEREPKAVEIPRWNAMVAIKKSELDFEKATGFKVSLWRLPKAGTFEQAMRDKTATPECADADFCTVAYLLASEKKGKKE